MIRTYGAGLVPQGGAQQAVTVGRIRKPRPASRNEPRRGAGHAAHSGSTKRGPLIGAAGEPAEDLIIVKDDKPLRELRSAPQGVVPSSYERGCKL